MRGYRPQLDSLRALAVTAVLYCHFWSSDSEFAELGVRLFFVLSGFLLTGILLREADEGRRRQVPRQRILFDFYVRRILRIWPAYYCALFAAIALGATAVQQTFGWHALFATNLLLFRERQWYPIMTGHLWTLSIEEQFYFVLPLTILFTSRKLLTPLLIGCIATSVLFRGGVCIGHGTYFYGVLPIAQMDALGGGALLALLQRQKGRIGWKRLVVWSLPIAVLTDVLATYTYSAVHFTFAAALYVLPMAALVAGADQGIRGWAEKLLSSRLMVTLGRISYGVYLYHMFVGAGVDGVLRSMGQPALPLGPIRFLILSGLTLGVATASWLLLERPALSLRRYFRRATETAAVVPAAPSPA